jgi:hypothetical protein
MHTTTFPTCADIVFERSEDMKAGRLGLVRVMDTNTNDTHDLALVDNCRGQIFLRNSWVSVRLW